MALLSSIRLAASGARSNKSKNVRMSIIQEDSTYSPTNSSHPTSSQSRLQPPPNGRFQAPPPGRAFSGVKFEPDTEIEVDQSQPAGESLRRLISSALLVFCFVGLVLGLAVGLSLLKKHSDMYGPPPSKSPSYGL